MKKIIVLIFCVFLTKPLLAENETVIEDLTIIVNSCDKYKECWAPFCTLLHRYWPGLKTHNAAIPVILIVNEGEFSHPGIEVLNTGKDKGWSDNMLEALALVKTNKVLYLQEDYFFDVAVNEQLLKSYVDRLNDPMIGYVQITNEPYFKDSPQYADYPDSVLKPRFMWYRTSLQPALWRKDLFAYLLKPGESPWAFEIEGSARSDGNPLHFISVKENFPLHFVNACLAGFWVKEGTDLLKKENLMLKETNLPHREDYPISFMIRDKLPKYYPYWKKLMAVLSPKFS